MHILLGNTFFGNAVGCLVLNRKFSTRPPLQVSAGTILYSLNEIFIYAGLRQLPQKGFLACAKSRFLMRAWLAGLMLAIFGLWLAVI